MTGAPRVAAGAAVLALAGSAAPSAAALGSGAFGPMPGAPPEVVPSASLPVLPALTRNPRGAIRRAARTAQARKGLLTVHLKAPSTLRAAPGGRSLGRVGLRTAYGAKRVFAAAAFAPGWVGVRAVQARHGRIAWLRGEVVEVKPTTTTLVADLSAREVTLRVGGRVAARAPIGIGRPGSETPLGRYGVTDRLEGGGGAGAYGCCVMPLTGHQSKLPPGWTGGTRIAFHGTPTPGTVGKEVSAGCLRMRNEDIRRILPRVPLGTTVTIRA